MSFIFYGFAVLLSFCGLRYVECNPAFSSEPNNGAVSYVLNGQSSFNLAWDYNSAGEIVDAVYLYYAVEGGKDVLVAAKYFPGGQYHVYPNIGYTNRVEFSERATFTVKNIVPSDSRWFKCVINFKTPPRVPGAITAINSAVEVVVVVRPSIIQQERQSSIELNEHDTKLLLCIASGNPKPSYTWKKNGAVIQQGQESNYTITSAKKEDRGQYTCEAVVSVPELSFTHSASYTVDVKVKFAPHVNSLLSNQTLDEGNDASFTCKAEAYPASITFNWFKNLTKISVNAEFSIVSSGSESRLTVRQIKKDSAAWYSCSGQNTVGTGEKKSVYLGVNYPPKTVTVTTSPSKVNEGQSMTLTCHSDGFPLPTFSWTFNNRVLNGALKSEFLLANAEVKDSGNYTCIAANSKGKKRFTKVVNVHYKPTVTHFTTGNAENSAVKGRDVTLTCSANGFPIPQYIIKRNKTEVTRNGPGTFVVRNVQLSTESDTYSCEPLNDQGRGPIKELKITVYVPPYFPAISLSRANKTENDTHTFSCTAEGKPQARILWRLNGKNLTHTPPYNISESFSKVQDSKLYKTLGYLTITSITWKEKGLYSCVAYNPAGQETQSAELSVKYRPVVQFLQDHPKSQTLAEGQDVTFYCKMIGNPPTVRHKWQFKGVDIPSASCDNGCSFLRYTKSGVTQEDAGLYSCIGWNELGYGPPATAELFVKHPPKIRELPQSSYTVNETNNVTMVCYTEGIPRPRVTWQKASNDEIVGFGEVLTIANITGSYDGKYTCTAENELGTDSKGITLHVQTRPVITTSTPLATNVPGAVGELVTLSCIAKAKPPPKMSWKTDLNEVDLKPSNDGKVTQINAQVDSIEMMVKTSSLNEVFYCVAVNLLGSDSQIYRIRERGPPDPPQDVKLVSFPVPEAKTVSVNVSWTPGYDGGFRQEFSIHYKRKGAADFTEESVGNPPNYMHTVQQLRPQTDYEFKVLATNERGKSQASHITQVMTIESAKPPDRGTVKATRSSDDHSVIIVTWTLIDDRVTTLRLEMTEGSFRAKRDVTAWRRIPGSENVNVSDSEFRVENLIADKAYTFRVGLARNGEDLDTCVEACYVYSDPVPAAPVPGERGGDVILQDWMIAVIAAVAGLLLICIVLLCLCCFIRRKKSHGADRVNMSQSSNYAVGGPEVSRSLDPRPRSYGLGSVEDDPFIEAHFASMQSMTSPSDKKKKPDTSVNYGYLSQDSVQNQPERLLEPGSRLARNRQVAQSTGNLGSGYPARGPQRDFNTLPPYYEPPSFEEAMRQSRRKHKTRKSTGDLVGPGQGRHSGRRPRQSTTDEPSDSSDGEERSVPLRAAPPPPNVRNVESQLLNPDYASEDHGLGTDSRGFPRGSSSTSAPRNNGPLDPSVPYAVPQKKLKSRRSRGELNDPTVEHLHPPIRMYGSPHHWQESHKGWPPPQYTRERSSEDLLQHSDLDLDDPSTLPLSERRPGLPPPMAMLSSNQFNSSYYDSATDGLPEPPAFLRDVVYPPGGREPRYDYSDDAASYEPPSPGPAPAWQRQPYVNINGQLHRAPSRDYTDFARPNPLRSSRDRLTPEPEIPPREWEPRRLEHDERPANYVSHLV